MYVPFTPPDSLNVLDQHGGFTAMTRGRSMRRGFSEDSLWRPGDVLRHGTTGALIPGSIQYGDFYQVHRPVISARYRLPGYGYPVKVWWLPDGTRLA